ncbi:MAG TPA: glycoside hydrolase family 9 protein, partial [Cellvibrionaceae bacterium]
MHHFISGNTVARRFVAAIALICVSALAGANNTSLTLNDKEYFEAPGLNVLVFSNWYDGLFSDSKISGVELIHHGERTATNGDVRLNITPEQWDAIPQFKERKVDASDKSIEAFLHYPEYGFNYSIKVTPRDGGIHLTVNLPEPLPPALAGKAGFNLEFIPSAYFHKSYMMDNNPGFFPVYPGGLKEVNEVTAPDALARGQYLVLAPEDGQRRVMIRSEHNQLALFDARTKAQNGWFLVRSEIPSGKTGDVISWQLNANSEKDWLRQPMLAYSQVGYHPAQKKVAVIELDNRDKRNPKAELVRVMADGREQVAHSAKATEWGQYLRYNYREFDFSSVREPGLYYLRYGQQKTTIFSIAETVYDKPWQPTLDVFFPVQMDHMTVEEAYRVWHGASHLDDALQAPVDHVHFDLYAQGPTTDTEYEPFEHIPGLNVGGWYDAGDYDIRTQSQYATVLDLVAVWENFRPLRDATSVDYERRHVQMFVADGKPDMLQQIEHGTLGLVAQHRALGRAIPGIVEAHIGQYTHLGDGVTKTDNLIYDASMNELQTDGFKSGKFDDRWAFTTKTTPLNYGS